MKVTTTGSFSTASHFDQGKKIMIIARLVNSGSFPVSELGKMKAYILNAKSEGITFYLFFRIVAFSIEGLGKLLISSHSE